MLFFIRVYLQMLSLDFVISSVVVYGHYINRYNDLPK